MIWVIRDECCLRSVVCCIEQLFRGQVKSKSEEVELVSSGLNQHGCGNYQFFWYGKVV